MNRYISGNRKIVNKLIPVIESLPMPPRRGKPMRETTARKIQKSIAQKKVAERIRMIVESKKKEKLRTFRLPASSAGATAAGSISAPEPAPAANTLNDKAEATLTDNNSGVRLSIQNSTRLPDEMLELLDIFEREAAPSEDSATAFPTPEPTLEPAGAATISPDETEVDFPFGQTAYCIDFGQLTRLPYRVLEGRVAAIVAPQVIRFLRRCQPLF